MAMMKKIDIAPDVSLPPQDCYLPDSSSMVVPFNLPVHQMYAPVVGPANPWRPENSQFHNVLTGHYEHSNLSDYMFMEEFRRHNTEGCPEISEADRAAKRKQRTDNGEEEEEGDRTKKPKTRTEGEGEDGDDSKDVATTSTALVPRGGDQSHVDPKRMQLVAKQGGNALVLPGDEEKEGLTVYFEEDEKRGRRVARFEAVEPKSTLHLKQIYDYQGRSFMQDSLRDCERPAFLPKKLLHTWRGHNKGVQRICWFPPHGHLILSGGLDGKVKLWDVCNTREVIQTYVGHGKAIKDIAFSASGERFVSASFDRFLRVWDTETGKVVSTFTTGRQPNVVRFHADEGKQDIFMAGMADKKVVQWDIRAEHITQEYDRHMGPVNSITFIDNNRKFVTSSDDKTLRVWEWDINVDIKIIAEPSMHSMPSCTASPGGGKFLAYQSMDNSIRIYQVRDGRLTQHKKSFRGHSSSGYACQVAWSNDGRYLCCGDGDGYLCCWDWKTSRLIKRTKVHDKVCIGVLWHPAEQSGWRRAAGTQPSNCGIKMNVPPENEEGE